MVSYLPLIRKPPFPFRAVGRRPSSSTVVRGLRTGPTVVGRDAGRRRPSSAGVAMGSTVGKGMGTVGPDLKTSQDLRERVGTTVAGRAFDVLDPSRMNRTGKEGVLKAQDGRTGEGEGESTAEGRPAVQRATERGKCGNVERRRIREKKNPGRSGVCNGGIMSAGFIHRAIQTNVRP